MYRCNLNFTRVFRHLLPGFTDSLLTSIRLVFYSSQNLLHKNRRMPLSGCRRVGKPFIFKAGKRKQYSICGTNSLYIPASSRSKSLLEYCILVQAMRILNLCLPTKTKYFLKFYISWNCSSYFVPFAHNHIADYICCLVCSLQAHSQRQQLKVNDLSKRPKVDLSVFSFLRNINSIIEF